MIYKILFLPTGDYLGIEFSVPDHSIPVSISGTNNVDFIWAFVRVDREFSNKRKAKRFIKRRAEHWNGWGNWDCDNKKLVWRVSENININVIKEHLEIVRIS